MECKVFSSIWLEASQSCMAPSHIFLLYDVFPLFLFVSNIFVIILIKSIYVYIYINIYPGYIYMVPPPGTHLLSLFNGIYNVLQPF